MQQKEIQDKLYSMMCIIDDILVSNKIPYVLCGGTMLGAVRHNDFIPWDDDMDIVLRLADFDRAVKVLQENMPEYMRLVTPKDIFPHFFDYVFRIQDMRYPTHAHTVEDDFYNDKLNCLSIDVFLVQETADSLLAHKLFIFRQQIIYGLSMGHRYENNKEGKYSFIQKLEVAILSNVGKIIPMEKLYKMYWKKAKDNIDRSHKYYMMVNDIPQNIVKVYQSEWIRDSILVTFRDRKFPVVKGYHQLMTAKYGDYMIPVHDDKIYMKHYELDR